MIATMTVVTQKTQDMALILLIAPPIALQNVCLNMMTMINGIAMMIEAVVPVDATKEIPGLTLTVKTPAGCMMTANVIGHHVNGLQTGRPTNTHMAARDPPLALLVIENEGTASHQNQKFRERQWKPRRQR